MLAVSLFGAVTVSAANWPNGVVDFPTTVNPIEGTNYTLTNQDAAFDTLSNGLMILEATFTVPQGGLDTGYRYARVYRISDSTGWTPLLLFGPNASGTFSAHKNKVIVNHRAASIGNDSGGSNRIILGDIRNGETYQVTAVFQLEPSTTYCYGTVLVNGVPICHNVSIERVGINRARLTRESSAKLTYLPTTTLEAYVASADYLAYLAQVESKNQAVEITGDRYADDNIDVIFQNFGITVDIEGVVTVEKLTEDYLTVPAGAKAYIFADKAGADDWTDVNAVPLTAKASGASVSDGDVLKVISENGFTQLTYPIDGDGLKEGISFTTELDGSVTASVIEGDPGVGMLFIAAYDVTGDSPALTVIGVGTAGTEENELTATLSATQADGRTVRAFYWEKDTLYPIDAQTYDPPSGGFE